MRKRVRVSLDIVALVLVAGTVIVTLALASYHAADPPHPRFSPMNPTAKNWLGTTGAWLCGLARRRFSLHARAHVFS
jgi:hypothetical protein